MTADLQGRVLRIERTSIHDGSGLRTVVFLKGCALRCSWCSTPESQNRQPERGYRADLCRLCSICVEQCPADALQMEDGRIVHDPGACTGCFCCARACLHGAVATYGFTMWASEVIEEIARDEIFYFHSGGGVTISGGECLLQPGFTAAILAGCRLRGIDTAIETSLFAPWRAVEEVMPHLDTFFVDIKHPVTAKHKLYTGSGNETVLANLRKLDSHPSSFTLHLRIPLIPGINDSDADLKHIIDLARSLRRDVDLEILPYHRLGMATWSFLGRSYELAAMASPDPAYINERLAFLRAEAVGLTVWIGGGFGG